jgi:hypothetical protein
MADRHISHQLIVAEVVNVSVNLVPCLADGKFPIHLLNSEGSTVASVTGSNVKAGVGTDEVGVSKFLNHFGVSGTLIVVIGRSMTLTADHRTGNVGIGQDVVLAGGISVFAARTVTVFATDACPCVLCFAPRDIDGFNRRLFASVTISASF